MQLPRVLAGSRRRRYGFLVANGIAQALIAVAMAVLVRYGFDGLVLNPAALETGALATLSAGMLGTIMLTAWLRWRGSVDGEILGQGYVHAVRVRLFRHIAMLGADGAGQMSKGALMLRFVGDLTALRNWVSLGLARLTVSGLATVVAVTALALVEPVIALAVAVSIVTAGTLAFAVGPGLRSRTRAARRYRGRIATLVNDRVAHIGVVENFGQETREVDRVRRASKRLRRSLVERARVTGLLRALSEASAGFASLCALLVGALQVAGGHATPGAVVSAMVVAGLLAPWLTDLGRAYEYWNAAKIAREKQLQVLRLKPVGRSRRQRGGRPVRAASGTGLVELRRVSRAPVLEAIDLSIAEGERIALVGPNGSGKSTLLRIISGLIDPDEGRVFLAGEDIRRCHWPDVRRTFAMVAPDLPLLRGSLRLNLTYGVGTAAADTAGILEIVGRCGLEKLVARLPGGLDARILENGAGLSTGERMRIAIARALLAKPRVLLLDEAEANLDVDARAALEEVIDAFPGTVVFATHDAGYATRAGRVVMLSAGRSLHSGGAVTSHASLPGSARHGSAIKLVS